MEIIVIALLMIALVIVLAILTAAVYFLVELKSDLKTPISKNSTNKANRKY